MKMTNSMSTETSRTNGTLDARWRALRAEQSSIRQKDAAEALGVSEAELLAARRGDGVERLAGPWGELIKKLPDLGVVMALTRNENVVHEKVGQYEKISIMQNMGLVLNEAIDLRIFLNHWAFGFAVFEPTDSAMRRSLQFFDVDGRAVHKIYLRDDSDIAAYEALVASYRYTEHWEALNILPAIVPPADRPDAAIDQPALRDRWQALQDVHDFHAMLQDLGAGRVQALRLIGEDWAYRVENDSFQLALNMAANAELPIMIFAGNAGVIQIHTGPVQQLKRTGPWFNVLDADFNLHLREDRIAQSWVVKKPTADGIVTSLELYDENNNQIAWMFGARKPGQPELEAWRALVGALADKRLSV
jgi:putative hemin transport protein